MNGVIEWLLQGDPAIRWQVQRDLLGAPESRFGAERASAAKRGWGRKLLAEQAADGHWGGGIYSPKWTSTTYTLLLLRDFGLPQDNPRARRGCETFFFRGLERDGGVNWFKSYTHSETCVNGMILSLLAYFRVEDARLESVASFLLREQMPDGGWNCQRANGATHASFHTTISVLEGLREYCAFKSDSSPEIEGAMGRGKEFLLRHRLYRSHRTGQVVDSEMTRMHFPPRWHFDFLRGLDYFQSIHAPRDVRLAEAVELLESRRTEDGRWPLHKPWTGRVYFELEESGRPSRWNTLRALRVLKWWYGMQAPLSSTELRELSVRGS